MITNPNSYNHPLLSLSLPPSTNTHTQPPTHPYKGSSPAAELLMETCKPVSWCQFSEEESMTSKEEESSSCSQILHNLISNCNRVYDEECSMCGDVGLPQYLFKCLTCSHRYQHIYCSKFYPYRIEATICNWCLPMEHLGTTTAEADANKDMKASNSINYSYSNTKPVIEAIPNCQIDHPVPKLEKHTKAFEYLLQVAELHDQGHQWDSVLACPPFEDDDCIIGKFSQKNSVGHCPNNGICKIYGVGHIANELHHQQPGSLMMHQLVISGGSDDQDRRFYARRGDKVDYVKKPSTISAQLRYNHSHSYMGRERIGMNQDVGHSPIIERNVSQDQGQGQIMENLNNQGLAHNQTIKKLNDQLDGANAQQEPAMRPVKDHGIDCSGSDDHWPNTSGAKRARLHKQLQAATGSNHRNSNATDQQKVHSGQQDSTAYNGSSDDSDEQLAGRLGDSMGLAKRPRLNRQSGAQGIAGDNYGLNPASRQRAGAGNCNEQGNTSAEDRQRSVVGMNQSSPTQQHGAAAWSRPAAGKRDHLMNSPSRGINRRYKLLADVLC